MKNVFLLLTLAISAAGQTFDFKSLDKLGANAKNATNVTLDRNMLKLAANFLGGDDDAKSLRALVKNLNGIYVRVYSFDRAGQYSEGDLAPLRTYLAGPAWNRIVESKSPEGLSEVYLQPLPNDQIGGVAIISVESKEVAVIYVSGVMNPADVGKLSGNFGIPDIKPMAGAVEKRK